MSKDQARYDDLGHQTKIKNRFSHVSVGIDNTTYIEISC